MRRRARAMRTWPSLPRAARSGRECAKPEGRPALGGEEEPGAERETADRARADGVETRLAEQLAGERRRPAHHHTARPVGDEAEQAEGGIRAKRAAEPGARPRQGGPRRAARGRRDTPPRARRAARCRNRPRRRAGGPVRWEAGGGAAWCLLVPTRGWGTRFQLSTQTANGEQRTSAGGVGQEPAGRGREKDASAFIRVRSHALQVLHSRKGSSASRS